MTKSVSEFEICDKVFAREMRNVDGNALAVGGFGHVINTDNELGVKVHFVRSNKVPAVWFAPGNVDFVSDDAFPEYERDHSVIENGEKA